MNRTPITRRPTNANRRWRTFEADLARDPHVLRLEALLEGQREISQRVSTQLDQIQARYLAVLSEKREPADPPSSGSEWTLAAYMQHAAALRQADKEFAIERDRRYYEVDVEKEKALKIKETADLAALGLAREIQAYKDEKANELRKQIEDERGLYPTRDELRNAIEKLEAVLKPVTDFVASQRGADPGGSIEKLQAAVEKLAVAQNQNAGRDTGISGSWRFVVGAVAITAVIIDVATRFR